MVNYLESLALTDFLLRKLNYETREQVPTTAVTSITGVSFQLLKKLEDATDFHIKQDANNLAYAVSSLKGINFGNCITENCKNILIEAVVQLRGTIRMQAFEYYKVNDFEPTPEIIKIMRGVVEEALSRGAI